MPVTAAGTKAGLEKMAGIFGAVRLVCLATGSGPGRGGCLLDHGRAPPSGGLDKQGYRYFSMGVRRPLP